MAPETLVSQTLGGLNEGPGKTLPLTEHCFIEAQEQLCTYLSVCR